MYEGDEDFGGEGVEFIEGYVVDGVFVGDEDFVGDECMVGLFDYFLDGVDGEFEDCVEDDGDVVVEFW